MNKPIKNFSLYQTNDAINKFDICCSIKKHCQKPTGGYCSQIKNHNVNMNEFKCFIENGHTFKHCYNIDLLKQNVYSLAHNYKYPIRTINAIKNEKVTMNILQRKTATPFCYFQCVFFDIDICNINNHELLISKLKYKPNIVYETFSYQPEKPKFRFVYILNKPMSCIYYDDVYNVIAKTFNNKLELDKSASRPTQTFFGTNKNVYITNNKYYEIESNKPINSVSLFDNSISTQCCTVQSDIPLSSVETKIVETNFYNFCCRNSMKTVLEYYKSKCILIKYEIPPSIYEKYIYKFTGLITLPTYYNTGTKHKKIILHDHRKYYIENVIANLLLLMNCNMTSEDLIYNVFNWCNEHICYNKKQNSHILNNKIIIQLCINTYKKFNNPHSDEYEKYLNELKLKHLSNVKNYINPYYFGLHFDDDTFCSNRLEIFRISKYEYTPISLEQLKMEHKKIRKTRSDKQLPKSETTKLIIQCLKLNMKNKSIMNQLKMEHGINTSSQNISKIRKTYFYCDAMAS